jgi:hypothetical protein
MDLHLFRPAVDTRGYFTVNGSEVMPHKDFSFGLVLDAGFGMLRYNGFENDPNQAADEASYQSRIAKQGFTGTFSFNFGLFDRLVLGIQLPITFFRGNAVQVPDRGGTCTGADAAGCLYNFEAAGLQSQGVGDLSIHAKTRLLNLGESPIGIAVILQAGFNGQSGAVRRRAGFRFGRQPCSVPAHRKIRFALEGGYHGTLGRVRRSFGMGGPGVLHRQGTLIQWTNAGNASPTMT